MRSATNKSELSQLYLTFYHSTFSPFKNCNTVWEFTLKLKLGSVDISCIEWGMNVLNTVLKCINDFSWVCENSLLFLCNSGLIHKLRISFLNWLFIYLVIDNIQMKSDSRVSASPMLGQLLNVWLCVHRWIFEYHRGLSWCSWTALSGDTKEASGPSGEDNHCCTTSTDFL